MDADSYRLVKRSVNGLTSETPVDGVFIKAASLGSGHDDIEVDAVNSLLLSKLDSSHDFTIACRDFKAGIVSENDEDSVLEFFPLSREYLKSTPVPDRFLALAYAEVDEAPRMVDRIADHRAAKMSTAAMAAMLTTMLQCIVDYNQKYGLVHNDLHQGNVLYDKQGGRLVVIDYGRSVFRKKAALKGADVSFSQAVKAVTGLAGDVDVGTNEYADPWHWDHKNLHEKYYWVSDYATICMQIYFGCFLKSTGTVPSATTRQEFKPLDHLEAVRKYMGRALTKIVEPAAHLYHSIVVAGMATTKPCFNANFTMTKTGTTALMDHLKTYLKNTGITAAIFRRNDRDVALNYHVLADFVNGMKTSGLTTAFGEARAIGGGVLPEDEPEGEIECPFPTSLQEAYGAAFRGLTHPLDDVEKLTPEEQLAAESIGQVDFDFDEVVEQLPPAMPVDKAGFVMPQSYENSGAFGKSTRIGAWSPEDEQEDASSPYDPRDYDDPFIKRQLPVNDQEVAPYAVGGGRSGASVIANLALAAVIGACSVLGSMR